MQCALHYVPGSAERKGMGDKHKERSVCYQIKMRYTVFFKLYATEDFRRPCRESFYDVTSSCVNKEEF
jgi:hypothetical protein